MAEITIAGMDGVSFNAIISCPAGGHGAGLILVRGLFESDEEVRAQADHYAALGYVTICPTLFHRQLNGASMPAGEPDWDQALSLYKNFDVEAGVRDLLATVAKVRKMPACGGKVGVIGYCLGSRMAFLLSARSDIDCAIVFYGVGIETMLNEVSDIRAPSLFHFAENDKLMPAATRQKILTSLAKNQALNSFVYQGTEHGFARTGGTTFNETQATLAHQRTEVFLKDHLQK